MALYGLTASNQDGVTGTSPGTTGITLDMTASTAFEDYGWANIDTSGIGTDVITAGTFYWYHHSYFLSSREVTYHRRIKLAGYTILGNADIPTIGWDSQALDSIALAAINKTGVTVMTLVVDIPAYPGGVRGWKVRAWDYVPNGTFSCYLVITHGPAGSIVTATSIFGV